MTWVLIAVLGLAISALVSVFVGRWLSNQRALECEYAELIKAAWESGAEPPWPSCPRCGGMMVFLRDEDDGISVYEHCGTELRLRRVISGFVKGAPHGEELHDHGEQERR